MLFSKHGAELKIILSHGKEFKWKSNDSTTLYYYITNCLYFLSVPFYFAQFYAVKQV